MFLILFFTHICAILANPFLKGSIPIIFLLGYLLDRKIILSPVPGPISIIIFLFSLKNKLLILRVLINFFRIFFLQVRDFLIASVHRIIFAF